MTAVVSTFALIGERHPGEIFAALRTTAARTDRRQRQPRGTRPWAAAARDAIILPKRLSA